MKKLIYLTVPLLLLIIAGCSNPGDTLIGPGSTVDTHQSLSADDASQKPDQLESLRESSTQQREHYLDPWAGAERHGRGNPTVLPFEAGERHCGPH